MDTVVRNVCWLSPPEPPIFDNTPNDAKKRMLNFRDSCSAYQNYTKHCLDKGNGTFTASPEPTSTPSPTTFVSRVTSSPVLTTEFTNISSQQNDTIIRPKPELNDLTSDSGSNAVIPVIITVTVIIILLLAAFVVAVWHIKKKKGSGYRLFIQVQKFFYKDPSIRRNRTVLQNHDSVNYLNNKAEVGEKWGGAQENVNYQHSKADKVQNWNGNQTNATDWDSKNLHKSHNETHNVTKSHKNHEHIKNVKNNIELGEYTKNANTSNPAATQRRQNKCDDEVIYANSQFEKVAKARNKKGPVEKVPSIRDATPPADVKTQDMYYIDENPYDRVDRREKPVPKKRNKVT